MQLDSIRAGAQRPAYMLTDEDYRRLSSAPELEEMVAALADMLPPRTE